MRYDKKTRYRHLRLYLIVELETDLTELGCKDDLGFFMMHSHLLVLSWIIWASLRENLSSGVCEQHRRRPACASAQTAQRLCYSLLELIHV